MNAKAILDGRLRNSTEHIFKVQQLIWEGQFNDAQIERMNQFLLSQTAKQNEFDREQTEHQSAFDKSQANKKNLEEAENVKKSLMK